MEAKDKIITDFIGNKSSTFKIPPYQRKYKWSFKKEVSTLLEDIDQFIKMGNQDYFLGSIVVKKDNSLNSNFILVDGQQRVTTILLIAAAARQVLKKSGNIALSERVKMLLEADENKFKLSRIKDQNIIQMILNDNISSLSSLEKESSYFSVYEKLVSYFKAKDINFMDTFYHKGLSKIKIALINLDSGDDEFLVFESINSKGASLTSSDLIKNYVMMSLDKEPLESAFENEVLDMIGEINLPDFYRQILAIKFGSLFSKNSKQMYYKFKEKFKKETIDEEFVKNLMWDAKVWEYIHSYSGSNTVLPLIKGSLLNWYSFLHTSVKLNSKFEGDVFEVTNIKNIDYVFENISKISVLRTLYGYGRVEANRGLAYVAFDFAKSIGHQDFLGHFNKSVLRSLEGSTSKTRTPSFEEIKLKASENDLYNNNKGMLKMIFIAIEQEIAQKQIKTTDLSVEHIFPQNPSDEWDEKDVFESKSVINTIGNLSITNDNSALGNQLFEKKKALLEKRSYLKINKWIYEKDGWDIESIFERQNTILLMIKKMWKL